MTWAQRFLDMAQHVAQWSKDPSTKVGAVIVRPNRTIASVGYNGLPRGIHDNERALLDRDYKLARTVHAEMNAVLNCDARPEGCTLYVWPIPPCSHCAACIIQAGITKVVSPEPSERWRESCQAGAAMLAEAGVEQEWVK